MPLAYGSFTYAWDASELTDRIRIVGYAIDFRGLSSFEHPSAPAAPSLGEHYPASSIIRATPSPYRPSLPLAGYRLLRAHGTERVSRVATSLIFHACQRQYPGESVSVPVSLASRAAAVFPIWPEDQHSHHPFRGLLSVHSRSGPHDRQAALAAR